MSRIGRKPIVIPKGVTVTCTQGRVVVKGSRGELSANVHPAIDVQIKDSEIQLSRNSEEKPVKALHGLWRALIQNMIRGVSEGFSKKLEIVGVGYRAEMKGKKLQLQLGYSHPIVFGPPEGIKIEAPTQTNIVVSGPDKQLVGLVAAKIRSLRPPEPYKGKGIKYEGEYIRRKAGKAAATATK
ncbi:MAG TPA: 50S ribosomal protein L6 [Bacteroidota bacterium]|nr:50S ribosomal protein L6 [Bacteroidota bacterium]